MLFGPEFGVLTPGLERLKVFLHHVFLFAGHFDERIVVRKGMEFDLCIFEILGSNSKPLCEDGYHSFHVAAFVAKGVDGNERALSRRHKVFDHNDSLATMYLAFNLIGQTVFLLF